MRGLRIVRWRSGVGGEGLGRDKLSAGMMVAIDFQTG